MRLHVRRVPLQLLLLLGTWLAVTGHAEPVTWEEITALTAPAPTARIAYGPAPQQFGELRLPAGPGPFPVAVIIHGGCWLSAYDLTYAAPFAAAIAQKGVATWTIEYRRVGDPGGGWPGTFEDIALGIDAVRNIAAHHPIDTARVVLIGHSAGGQLALWAAAPPREKSAGPRGASIAVRGVITLAGITDLDAYRREGGPCGNAVVALLGGTPAKVASRYAALSPAALVPLQVPTRLLHGELDPIVPVEQSAGFVAHSVPADTSFTVLAGAGHFDFFAPGTPAFAATLKVILELLQLH